ncbi:MAG: hypothetical protein ACRENK_01085 [Gemmatimonadaceae bacterium]
MLVRYAFTATLLSATLVACASAPTPGSASTDAGHTADVVASARRWTGNFTATQSVNGSLVPSTRQSGNGSVELTVARANPGLTHVRLRAAVSIEPGLEVLGWSINPGNCGSGDTPILSPSVFPLMQLNPNGQANFDDNIPWELPESGNYHVNVFRGSNSQLNNVVTCADLRRKD